MKTISILLVLLASLAPATGFSDTLEISNIPYSILTDSDGSKYIHVSLPIPLPKDKTIVTFVEIQFESAIAPQRELELWENLEGRRPWDLGDHSGVARAQWVTQSDGSPLVRFNVTNLARDWMMGRKDNNGVLIRLRPGQDSRDLVLKEDRHIKLLYHVLSGDQ